jgi:hypothetical protein
MVSCWRVAVAAIWLAGLPPAAAAPLDPAVVCGNLYAPEMAKHVPMTAGSTWRWVQTGLSDDVITVRLEIWTGQAVARYEGFRCQITNNGMVPYVAPPPVGQKRR